MVVLSRGKIEQQGKARELYEQPHTSFVRDFIGKTVVLDGRIRSIDAMGIEVELSRAPGVLVHCSKVGTSKLSIGQHVYLSVRPEDIAVVERGRDTGGNSLKGTIETIHFVGDRSECQVKVGEERVLVYVPRKQVFEPGEPIHLFIPRDAINLWPA